MYRIAVSGYRNENIFISSPVEYYRRLNHLNNPYPKRNGIYLGVTLLF